MGHILRIDRDPNLVEVNHNGWTKSTTGMTGERIKHIVDTVANQEGAKIGTSIPSPFARMYLFDTAFQLVARDPQPKIPTSYHTLVSHCLDLLELLFQSGSGLQTDLTFKVWKKAERLEVLGNPKNDKGGKRHSHRILAKALELDLQGDLADLQSILLIYYRGVLLGGTSPLSFVFTSPNAEDGLRADLYPKGWDGRPFFQPGEYIPLERRNTLFVSYLKVLYDTCKDHLSGIGEYFYGQFSDAGRHLKLDGSLTPDVLTRIPTQLPDAPYLQIWPETAGRPALFLQTMIPDYLGNWLEKKSDFIMLTTRDYYRNELRNGAPSGVKPPMALASKMHVRGLYIPPDKYWDPETTLSSSFLVGQDLAEGGLLVSRELPGVDDVVYPFVTTDDFLENFLVRMPFPINGKRFFTGTSGADCPFLLPVRKEYFNFFGPEDLRRQFRLIIREKEVEAVLEIPIRGGEKTVPFRKIYQLSDPDTVRKLDEVGLGFFPFFRFREMKKGQSYTVLLADGTTEQETSLHFYRFDGIIGQTPVAGMVKPEPRTTKFNHRPASYFYKVPEAFDCIELKAPHQYVTYRGLILPEFIPIDERNSYRKFTVAVDFGTSNTYVAYRHDDQTDEPATLTVTDAQAENQDDAQVVLLNKPYGGNDVATAYARYTTPSSFGGFDQLESVIRREFIPVLIGKDEGSYFSFPLRTAVYEREGIQDGGDYLFTKLNLGFNIDLHQHTLLRGNRYQTNLKWLFENKPNEALNDLRIRTFLETILMLIRHKVIQNKGIPGKTSIVWLRPSSMGRKTFNRLDSLWKEAMRNVFGEDLPVPSEPILESLAPYFYLRTKNKFLTEADAVNIDIGGGTTDVMVFASESDRYLNTSFRFAANDIWGAGLDENGASAVRGINGFLQMYQEYRKNNPVDENEANTRLIPVNVLADAGKNDGNIKSAEDIISVLFKYDDFFQFSKALANQNPDLLLVLYLHYAAVIYHLVQFLEENALPLPRFLSFTGRGSQYVRLLGTKSDLKDFTLRLLRAYSPRQVPYGFDILTPENPKEVSAKGAVLYQTAEEATKAVFLRNRTTACWGNLPGIDTAYTYNTSLAGELDEAFHQSVLQNVGSFLEQTLSDPEIRSFLKDFGIGNLEEYGRYLTGPKLENSKLKDCYGLALRPVKLAGDQPLSETFFFLPLKHALYELAHYIAEKPA